MAASYRIAVVGDRDSVLGFQALGVAAFPVENGVEARAVLHRIAGEDYGIICLTEDLVLELEGDIARYQDAPVPAILLIPGGKGLLGVGMGALRAAAVRAVGLDILGDKQAVERGAGEWGT